MIDPTYNKAEIKANPVWHVAWIMSECLNDSSPIGWSKYISTAEQLKRSRMLRGTRKNFKK